LEKEERNSLQGATTGLVINQPNNLFIFNPMVINDLSNNSNEDLLKKHSLATKFHNAKLQKEKKAVHSSYFSISSIVYPWPC
jgi:hypothetical protein